MNRRFIDMMIPEAIKSIEKHKIATDGAVPSAFNGYISSFATSVVQAGIRQSVIFFCDENAKTKESRTSIMMVLQDILQTGKKMPDEESLVNYVNTAGTDKLHQFKLDILDAAVACKMALRTFKKVETKK